MGDVSPELKLLTLAEEILITECREKWFTFNHHDHRNDMGLPMVRRGVGDTPLFSQPQGKSSDAMPPEVGDIFPSRPGKHRCVPYAPALRC